MFTHSHGREVENVLILIIGVCVCVCGGGGGGGANALFCPIQQTPMLIFYLLPSVYGAELWRDTYM